MRPAIISLVRASHFPPTVTVTAITTALAVSVGRGGGAISVAGAVGAGQLAVGWSNDYIDRDRDRLAGRHEKPIVAGQVRARSVRRAAIVAAVLCVPLSMLSGWRPGLVHLAAVACALVYNLGVKATWASPLPYALAFAALPAFVTLGLAGHPWPPAWAVAAAASLGCGAHFINTLDDLSSDRRLGVLGMPQRFGPSVSIAVGASLLALASVTLAFAPPGTPNGAVLALFFVSVVFVAGVVLAAWLRTFRIAWPLTLGTALVVVAMLLARGKSFA